MHTIAHPHWGLEHKKKGTEIRKIAGQYYLYQVTSKWDPVKKRPRKTTLGLIGAIKKDKEPPSRRWWFLNSGRVKILNTPA